MTQPLATSDRTFLSHLLRAGPSAISDLCALESVTATAVRQRLQRLEVRGLIEKRVVRAERGRPHHVYEITDLGRRELGQNYAELAVLLWDELRQIEEQPVRERVLGRVRQAMVEQFREHVNAASPNQRMSQLAEVLGQRGFEVETTRNPRDPQGLPVLREHTCPYQEIASQDSSICELEQAVFEEVVGAPLELTHCCQRGDRACEFEAVGIPKSETDTAAVRV